MSANNLFSEPPCFEIELSCSRPGLVWEAGQVNKPFPDAPATPFRPLFARTAVPEESQEGAEAFCARLDQLTAETARHMFREFERELREARAWAEGQSQRVGAPTPKFELSVSENEEGSKRTATTRRTRGRPRKSSTEASNSYFSIKGHEAIDFGRHLESIKKEVLAALRNRSQLFSDEEIEDLTLLLSTEDRDVRRRWDGRAPAVSGPREAVFRKAGAVPGPEEKAAFLSQLVLLKRTRVARKIRRYSKIRKVKRMLVDYLKTSYSRSRGLKALSRAEKRQFREAGDSKDSVVARSDAFREFVAAEPELFQTQVLGMFVASVVGFIRVVENRCMGKQLPLMECLKENGEKVPWTPRQLFDAVCLARRETEAGFSETQLGEEQSVFSSEPPLTLSPALVEFKGYNVRRVTV